MRSIVPGLKFSATTSKLRHEREEQLAALGRLQVDADAALVEVVAQVGRADLAARRDRPSPASTPGPTRRASGARPSRPRRRGGRASGSRTAAPASARPRARARRRAACRNAARRRSPCRRVARRDTVRAACSRPLPLGDPRPGRRVHSPPCEESSAPRGYVPFRRLDRADIAKTFGSGGGKGTRSVASYDEDTTTMGVEAARLARRSAPDGTDARRAVVLHRRTRRTSTRTTRRRSTPRCGSTPTVAALDFGGALRSGVGALRTALDGNGCVAGRRVRHARRPADERRRVAGRRRRGRAARRRRRRRPGHRRVPRRARARPRSSSSAGARPGSTALARVGGAVRRDEVRAARRAGVERGAEGGRALARPGRPADRHRHARACRARHRRPARRVEGSDRRRPRRDGRQHRHRARRAAAHERARDGRARPGDRARRARRRRRRAAVPHDRRDRVVPAGALGRDAGRQRRRRSPTASSSRGAARSRSSRPAGPSPIASRRRCRAAARSGSTRSSARATTRAASCTCRPRASRASATRSTTWTPAPMSEVEGTIALFTIDRIAYSPSPPITFAVVDFDGGGRLPVELTDVDVDGAEDRRPGRDDVPQAVHRRRHPQLLLEGPPGPGADERSNTWLRTASRTRSRSSAWAARRSASTGTRAPTTC